MPRTAEPKPEPTIDEQFEASAKRLAMRGRSLAASVADWRKGGELEDLVLEVQLSYRKLEKEVRVFAAITKALQSK